MTASADRPRSHGSIPRRVPTTIVMIALLASPAAAQSPPAATESPPAATVGDIVITQADLAAAMRRRGAGKGAGAESPARFRAQALADLIDEALLRTELDRRQIAASDGEIDARIAGLTQELATRKSSLDAFLADQGLDRAALRRRMAFDIAMGKLAASLVTPESVGRAYQEHHRAFDGTRVRVAHLILRPDGSEGTGAVAALTAKAERIRQSILAGEVSFADAAARHSAGPSRHRGGDLGFIPRQGLLAEEFTRPCYTLERGEISRPIESPFGVHLVTVLDIDAGNVDREQFRPQLERLAAQQGIREILEASRERIPVSLEPGMEAAERGGPTAAP